jgi:hypothetical protein
MSGWVNRNTGEPFISAWSDPDHVRLAMYRSWWDEGASDRGPLPAGEDPWQVESLAAKAAAILGISIEQVEETIGQGQQVPPGPQMASRVPAGGLR